MRRCHFSRQHVFAQKRLNALAALFLSLVRPAVLPLHTVSGSSCLLGATEKLGLRPLPSTRNRPIILLDGLQPGITHLWTTPVLRHRLVGDEDIDLLASMESLVLRKFRALSYEHLKEGERANDRFFALQREAFEKGDPSFLESEASPEERTAFESLCNAWLENAREYVATVASEEVADRIFADLDALRMFVWASVHEGTSEHVPHEHTNTAVSGVFYVSVPQHSGGISFFDPRREETPFETNRLNHEPLAGDLLLFPPWLVHKVEPSSKLDAPRISISFNIFTMRGHEADFQELADTSVPPDTYDEDYEFYDEDDTD